MASIHDIKKKIKIIQGTKQITKAMEMIAANKMKKTQQRMHAARPYAEKLKTVIAHLMQSQLEIGHELLGVRAAGAKSTSVADADATAGIEAPSGAGSSSAVEARHIFLVISSDRGLCGGLNNNLFRLVINQLRTLQETQPNAKVEFFTIGKKAEAFFRKFGFPILAALDCSNDTPKLQHFLGLIQLAIGSFCAYENSKLYLAYNNFVNGMVQQPVCQQLLPIQPDLELIKQTELAVKQTYNWDYLYEPDPKVLLDQLLNRYAEILIYQGVLENLASEQAARMLAMKNATDSAQDLIDTFKLQYNKCQQALITKELAEIVAGAAAV